MMRTTVTLDPDTHDLLERHMREHHVSFKRAVNDAIRIGLGAPVNADATFTRPRSLGPARVPLDGALRLAGELEDAELVRRVEQGR